MERVILHVDANSYYASVECLYNPDIRDKPVAVGGDVEARHGIILTKNQIAKKYGIKTGEAIWQAKQKCPGLVCVPPDFGLYIRFSKRMRRMFEEYSDRVESFGLDEAWIDLTNRGTTITDGERLAHEIRERVKGELGLTVSVGVSYNKIFAKLGSDMKKPDAVTVIRRDDYQKKIWELPVEDLLYVGRSTRKKLSDVNVLTIGALAKADTEMLDYKLGKNGLTLKAFANGLDQSPVMPVDYHTAIKSIGNSTTLPYDIETLEDARCVYYLLAESVAARLRENGFRSRCVSISARTTKLITGGCQQTLQHATNLTDEIAETAMELFMERFARHLPYRSVGISCSMLMPDTDPVQLDLLGDEMARLRKETLEHSVDDLRRRYGHQILQRGVVLTHQRFAQINPKEDHTIHPMPFFTG
jgi:DNA polymerase IV